MPFLPRELLLLVQFSGLLAVFGLSLRAVDPLTWYRLKVLCAPRSAKAHLILGDRLMRHCDDHDGCDRCPTEAVQVYSRAAELDGSSTRSLRGLANSAAFAGEPRLAVESASRLTRANPSDPRAWYFLGELRDRR